MGRMAIHGTHHPGPSHLPVRRRLANGVRPCCLKWTRTQWRHGCAKRGKVVSAERFGQRTEMLGFVGEEVKQLKGLLLDLVNVEDVL